MEPGLFYNHLRNSLTDPVTDPFPQNLQNILNPKPIELMLYNIHHLSHVMCHMSLVTCNITLFFFTNWWRLCHQRGRPRLVLKYITNVIYYSHGFAGRRWLLWSCPLRLLLFQSLVVFCNIFWDFFLLFNNLRPWFFKQFLLKLNFCFILRFQDV